jgi:hypothetical protein
MDRPESLEKHDGNDKAKEGFVPLTATELNKVALALTQNQIFTDRHINPISYESMLPLVFMPIALGAFQNFTPEQLEDVGLIYEFYDQAGPRSINGYPCFVSMRILNFAETEYVFEKAKQIKKAIADVINES